MPAVLHLCIGKRPSRAVDAACPPGSIPTGGNRLFMRHRTNGRQFLVDTSAAITVIPPNQQDRALGPQPYPALTAVNGTPITSYGQRLVQIDLGLRRQFNWVCTVPMLPTQFSVPIS